VSLAFTIVIPGRASWRVPENPILPMVVMDSRLAASRRPGMTSGETQAKCLRISGRAFSAAPCLAKIFAIRSGAKFMSTNAGAVFATS
jgi:hypothetical protein